MVCKNHAAMKSLPVPHSARHPWRVPFLCRAACAVAIGVAGVWVAGAPARAAEPKLERRAPLTYEADAGKADLARKVYTLSGNVVITQGGLNLRAEQAQVRQGADGQAEVSVSGGAQTPARFEQTSTRAGESMQGQAQRIEYSGRSATVTLSGQAVLRRMRGAQVLDEISGASITYNRNTEEFQVQGEPRKPEGGGRVRGTLSAGEP